MLAVLVGDGGQPSVQGTSAQGAGQAGEVARDIGGGRRERPDTGALAPGDEVGPVPGLRHTADAGFTFSGMDRERGHAAATVGWLAAVPRSGLNPSGPRLASAPQR